LKKRFLYESARDQKRFAILEAAADWDELMIPQRTNPRTLGPTGRVLHSGDQIPPLQSAILL